jgi:hypothetical protein
MKVLNVYGNLYEWNLNMSLIIDHLHMCLWSFPIYGIQRDFDNWSISHVIHTLFIEMIKTLHVKV